MRDFLSQDARNDKQRSARLLSYLCTAHASQSRQIKRRRFVMLTVDASVPRQTAMLDPLVERAAVFARKPRCRQRSSFHYSGTSPRHTPRRRFSNQETAVQKSSISILQRDSGGSQVDREPRLRVRPIVPTGLLLSRTPCFRDSVQPHWQKDSLARFDADTRRPCSPATGTGEGAGLRTATGRDRCDGLESRR